VGDEAFKGAAVEAELLACVAERDRLARENDALREALQARVDELEDLRCVNSPTCVTGPVCIQVFVYRTLCVESPECVECPTCVCSPRV